MCRSIPPLKINQSISTLGLGDGTGLLSRERSGLCGGLGEAKGESSRHETHEARRGTQRAKEQSGQQWAAVGSSGHGHWAVWCLVSGISGQWAVRVAGEWLEGFKACSSSGPL